MTKRTLINQSDLDALHARANELAFDLRDATKSIRSSFAFDADVTTPLDATKAFVGLSAAASEMASALLIVLASREDRVSLEAKIRNQLKSDQTA